MGKRLAIVGLVAFLALGLAGCAWLKTGDTTAMTQSMTAGEQQPSPLIIPPDFFDPNSPLWGKTIVIYPPPGKDVTFKMFYADGTPMIDLATKRTDVLNALWAGANTSDTAKLLHDQWVIQTTWDNAQMIMDKALGAIMAERAAARQVAASQPAGSICDAEGNCTPKFKTQLQELILEALKNQSRK